ncbi:MAG TPA: Lpg1974 family pore-forming outer membrane protein [Rhabdochlamydiaceae bacterium]|nr:Lpg1974 family pore-forming outer membrane protein [Rhabdochlamydiaceae bacterium]
MFKQTTLFLLASFSVLQADDCTCCCQPQSTCPTTMNRCGPITVSARPTNLESGFDLFVDFFWWQAQEGGNDYAFIANNQELGPGGLDEEAHIGNKEVNFPWKPGFRAGIGYNFEYDQWDAQVYYSWYRTHKNKTVTTDFSTNGDGYNLTAIVPLHTDINAGSKATIDWSIHYSVIDAELGRNFFVSRHLALRPHIGLKTGWINQNVHFNMVGESANTNFPGPVQNKKKNDFWGIGPSGGIDTRWYLASFCENNFSLFGNFVGALMWGKFKVEEKQVEPGFFIPADVNHITGKGLDLHLIVPMLQIQAGLGWDTGFYDDCFHVALNIGYEIQYWFRQNQMLNVLPNNFNFGGSFVQIYYIYQRMSEDLRFHGLTIDLRVDF